MTTAVTNCAIHSAATLCGTCTVPYVKTATGDKCNTAIGSCKTHDVPAAGVTTAVCNTCNDGYVKKTDGSACY